MSRQTDHTGFPRETIGIIGAGHLGMSLAGVLIDRGFSQGNLLISHAGSPATSAAIREAGLKQNIAGNGELSRKSSVIFITVRPQSLATLEGLPFPRDGLVVSCMAGIPRAVLKKRLGIDVIRMMPSGSDTIRHNKGIAAIIPDNPLLTSLLTGMGLKVHILPDEESMHIFTAGVCLPAAILAYRAMGFDPDEGINEAAREYPLLISIYEWARAVLPEFSSVPEEEGYIERMCTPGGVTRAIVWSIRSGNIFSAAVQAGIARSREISREQASAGAGDSDEHDAEHGVRSDPGQPLAPEQRDKPGASSYQQETPENSEVL